MDHPLDRPIWTALSTRQAAFAQGASGIRRFDPAIGPFAASAEGTAESLAGLAALVPAGGHVCLQQGEDIAPPAGLDLVRVSRTVQMVAEASKAHRQPLPLRCCRLPTHRRCWRSPT